MDRMKALQAEIDDGERSLRDTFGADKGGLELIESIFDEWGDGVADIMYNTPQGTRNILKHELNRPIQEH